MKRTDPHRPGAIVPSDYEAILSFAIPTESDPGFGMAEVQDTVHAYVKRGAKVVGGAGKCGVCGANFGYGELWEYLPTHDLVIMGHECSAKYGLVGMRSDWLVELAALKKRRAQFLKEKVKTARRDLFLEAKKVSYPYLGEALQADHSITRSLKDQLEKHGTLSSKQIDLAIKVASEVRSRRYHDD